MSGDAGRLSSSAAVLPGWPPPSTWRRKSKRIDLPAEVTLVEASPRLGGKMQTVHKDGYVIERGRIHFWNGNKAHLSS